jgi:nicotinamidase-related amidase
VGPRAAVLALHYQNDVLHAHGKIRVGLAVDSPVRDALVAQARALLDGARHRRWPIFHVRVAFAADGSDIVQNGALFRAVAASGAVREGTWGAEFLDTLAPRARDPLEQVVTHRRINAFHATALESLVQACGAQRLVVAGVATHSVVEGTVRDAADRGYDVWVAADACAAADPAVHAASLASMGLIASIQTVRSCLDA